jgi:predicted lipoprotein DUF2279
VRALSPRILRRLARSLVLPLFASRLHAADSFRLFPPPPQHYFQEIPDAVPRAFDLDLPQPFGGGDGSGFETAVRGMGSVAPRAPRRTAVTLVTLGVLGGSVASALGTGHERESFHWANERWFQEDTYAGGGDKASHFVFYNGLSRELAVQYRIWGYGKDQATLMAFATAAAAGLIVEVGDGLTLFGFSWEDFVMDTLGAGTAAVVTRLGLDDTLGFRFGKMSSEEPPECCRTPGIGKDYSTEIYTADLKLAGFARRLSVRPGVARFLLVSMSYGSKGYRYSPPDFRQRQIGLEVGINFPEVLAAARVPEDRWWGRVLYFFFNFFRIPYTQIGVRYDLNHHEWHGPDAGNSYDPGP